MLRLVHANFPPFPNAGVHSGPVRDLYATAGFSIGLPIALDSIAVKIFQLVIAEYAHLTELRDDLKKAG